MDEEDQAATKVQTLYRGHAARKKADQLKYDLSRKRVTEYLHKHKIHQLLQHLLSLVAYHQPDDPKQYILKEIKSLGGKSKTDLFVDADLDTVFDMVDLTKQGFVTGQQLRHCSQNLAARVNEKLDLQKHYNREEFKRVLSDGLQDANVSW